MKPTAAWHTRCAGLKARPGALMARVQTVMEAGVAALNEAVRDTGGPAIVVPAPNLSWCT